MDISITSERLTDEQRRRIRRDVRELQVAENLSNALIARSLGVSPAVYSQVRAGKYAGDSDRVLRMIAQWLADRAGRVETPPTEYVPTAIGRLVQTVCRRAWRMPTIGIISTPSGCGKTAALLDWCRQRGDRAAYLAAGVAFSSQRGLLVELARKLGVPVHYGATAQTIYTDCRDRLAGYYAGGKGDPLVIVVDEATTLRPEAKHLLRNLHDDPAVRCGVVLADTGRLQQDLAGRSGRAQYEQVRSRSGAQFLMAADDAISADDCRAVADSVLAALGHNRALHRSAYAYLHRLAQADGKLRNVVNRLHAAHDVAEGLGRQPEYSVADLDYAASLVGAECEMEHDAPPLAAAV